MTGDPRAFFALDLGAATTAAAMIGHVVGRWRLLGSVTFPAGVPVPGILEILASRVAAADPELAQAIGAAGASDRPRLSVRSTPPSTLAVVAVSERSRTVLAQAAEKTGWRLRSASLETHGPIGLTGVLLDPEVSAILVGAGDPPGADERGSLGDLAALAAAVATRRPDATLVLAGAMAEQAPRFESPADRAGAVILAPAATAGTPAGVPLRELLERARTWPDDSRRAFVRGVTTLAETLDRRVEGIELGLDGAVRVHATPGHGSDGATVHTAVLSNAALVPPDPDEALVDRALAWSTVRLDRHRMRDRLRDLRLQPWGGIPGEGARLRLTAARTAVARLVGATPELSALPPADLLVVAGGAWAVAPGPAIALAVADVVRRPGACQLAYDHARLLAPIGAVEDDAERRALLNDLAGDLLLPLGSVVMPQGMRAGKAAGRLVVHGGTVSSELDLVPGGLELVDLPPGENAVAEFEFREPVRLGTRGRHFAVDVAGGLGGLLVDLRDIPLRLPDRPDRRREVLAAWQDALWSSGEA